MCQADGCNKTSKYGPKNGKRKFCNSHKEPNMVNLAHHICDTDGCLTKGIFSIGLDDTERFCKGHKTDEMQNFHTLRCHFKKCAKTGLWGLPGQPRTSCEAHKDDNMIKKGARVHVSICRNADCNKRAMYAIVNGSAQRYCREHKTDEMIDINCPTCTFPNCGTVAGFGVAGGKRVRCNAHKEANMVSFNKGKK